MCPMDGVSEKRVIPRLGKVRLGIKVEGRTGSTHPKATDYLVVPDNVKTIFGEQPKEIEIMFPMDDPEIISPQYFKCWSYSQGLICRGNGHQCDRKVDVTTGDFANRDSKVTIMAKGICDPAECPKYQDGSCKRQMTLLFLIPKAEGIGVYQLDTTSWYSIINVNSQIGEDPPGFLRLFTGGRIAGIPLMLSLEPREVTPAGEGRKTIHVLNLRSDAKIADIIRFSRKSLIQVLMPETVEEECPEDLFPPALTGGPTEPQTSEEVQVASHDVVMVPGPNGPVKVVGAVTTVENPAPPTPPPPPPPVPLRALDPKNVKQSDVLSVTDLLRIASSCWGMRQKQLLAELNCNNVHELTESLSNKSRNLWDCFLTLRATR
jgi:hypothetical protein